LHGKDLQKSEFHLKQRDKNNLKGRCGVCEYEKSAVDAEPSAILTGDLFESDPPATIFPRCYRKTPSILRSQSKPNG
jgi:hypothetical protein